MSLPVWMRYGPRFRSVLRGRCWRCGRAFEIGAMISRVVGSSPDGYACSSCVAGRPAYDGHMATDRTTRDAQAFDRWLTTEPGSEHDDDCDCSECENERALQDDFDGRQ